MKYKTDKWVAEYFGVSVPTIWRWQREGIFPKPIKLSPNCSRWSIEQIEAHDKKLAEQIEAA